MEDINKPKIKYKPIILLNALLIIIGSISIIITNEPGSAIEFKIPLMLIIIAILSFLFFIFYVKQKENVRYNKNINFSLNLLTKFIFWSALLPIILVILYIIISQGWWQGHIFPIILICYLNLFFISINLLIIPFYLNFINKKKRIRISYVICLIILFILTSITILFLGILILTGFEIVDLWHGEGWGLIYSFLLITVSTGLSIIFQIIHNIKLNKQIQEPQI